MLSRLQALAVVLAAGVLLPAPPAAAHFSTYDGIHYDVHGAATASIGPLGELTISNIGSSGEDGISLIVPDGGRGMIFDHEWGHRAGLGITTRRVISMIGVQGAAELEAMRVTIDVTDDGLVDVTADAPEGGATGILLQVLALNGENYREYLDVASVLHLEDATIPGSATSLEAGPARPRPLFAIKDQGVRIVQESPTLQSIELRFDQPVRVRTAAQPGGTTGDAIRLARTTGVPIDRLGRVKLTGVETPGSGVGSFAIKDQGVKVHDGVASALGGALFEENAGGDGVMRALDFGSSGLDGVRFAADSPDGHATEIGVALDELQFTQPPSPESRMTMELTGSIGGGPPQVLGRLDVTRPVDEVTLTPDFSSIGASTWGATILDGGVVVAELGGLSGNVRTGSRKNMYSWYMDLSLHVRLVDAAPPVLFTIGAASYQGTELVITPETGAGPGTLMADYFLYLETRAANLVSLGIEDVAALPLGPVVSAVAGPGPRRLDLRPPWPNPSREQVAVEFALERGAPVRASVVDPAGRRVRTLSQRWFPSGSHRVAWDGRDDAGRASPPGVYYVRIEGAGAARSVPVVRLK